MDQKKKIFIIDDDKNIRDAYGLKFTNAGLDVSFADNGKDAINMIDGGLVPDIILLDIIMPGLNGVEMLRKLRSKEQLHNTKIIFLSNLDQEKDVDQSIAPLISGYLLKVKYTPATALEFIKKFL